MKTVAIIQARMSSTRLPGKVLLPLPGGPTVLQAIVSRVCAAKRVDRVVVATSFKISDGPIAELCRRNGIPVFRGSESDVLDRVYQAALANDAERVVDITADCPLVDPRHIDALIAEMDKPLHNCESKGMSNGAPDYISNCFERDWPDGLDIQVYTMDALRLAWQSEASVREHVGWNIANQAGALGVHVRQKMAPKRYRRPEWGLTLDEPADYELIRRLFTEARLTHGIDFPVEWVLELLIERQGLLDINKDVKRKVPGNG